MPTTQTRKQRLKVSQDEEIPQDLESKMQEARQQIELLHAKKLEVERQRLEGEAREIRKQDFIGGQLEVIDKLSNAITTIERETVESKREIQELEATRKSFKAHLQKIEKLDADSCSEEKLDQFLAQSITLLDKADDEYDQAATYFSSTRRGGVFHGHTSSGRGMDDFYSQFISGLAFNLPLVILGGFGLIIYLIK